jgi:toxin ParE1/3/4
MRITFDPAARADLDDIFAWISKDNESAAYEMIARIEARIELLATPGLEHMGRPGLDEGTRELIEARPRLEDGPGLRGGAGRA